jgi:hypothetical protein
LQIDDGNLPFIVDIHVGAALAVGGEEFRFAAEVDLGDWLAGFGIDARIDHDQLPGVAAGHEDAVAGWIVDRAIGIVIGGDAAQQFVRFQVEDLHDAFFAVGDEAAPGGGYQGDAVIAFGSGNIRDDFAGGGVDHHGVRRAGEVEKFAGFIERGVIPAAVTADWEGFGDGIIIGSAGAGGSHANQGDDAEKENAEGVRELVHHGREKISR